jgi:hypothetical protein
VYNKPVLGLDAVTMAALIYSRSIEPQLLSQVEIPFGPDAWCPKNGGGIVIANDDAVGEFHPDLTMVIKIVS